MILSWWGGASCALWVLSGIPGLYSPAAVADPRPFLGLRIENAFRHCHMPAGGKPTLAENP